MATYKGFNTVDKVSPPWGETDINIVKQDIYNHFMTRKGERLMMPEFGSIIHDLLFEPFDEITQSDIIADAKDVIRQEPRVELIDINVEEFEHGLRLDIELNFMPQDTADHLIVDFERETGEAY